MYKEMQKGIVKTGSPSSIGDCPLEKNRSAYGLENIFENFPCGESGDLSYYSSFIFQL